MLSAQRSANREDQQKQRGGERIPSAHEGPRQPEDLSVARSGGGVSACLAERQDRVKKVPRAGAVQSWLGSQMGGADLQHPTMDSPVLASQPSRRDGLIHRNAAVRHLKNAESSTKE